MTHGNRIGCEMVEFHRFGGERTQLLSPDNEYIRTAGYDEPASAVRPCVDQEHSLDLLYQLRYQSGVTQDEVQVRRLNWVVAPMRSCRPCRQAANDWCRLIW